MTKKTKQTKDRTLKKTNKSKEKSKKRLQAKKTRKERQLFSTAKIEEAITQLFAESGDKIITYKQVCYVFGQTTMAQKRQVVSVLEEMVAFDLLEEVEMGRYRRKIQRNNTIEGIFTYQSGNAYFLELGKEEEEKISIDERKMGLAMNGDRVLVRKSHRKKTDYNKGATYEVVEILERNKELYVGTCTLVGQVAFFTSLNRNLRQDVFISPKHINGAKNNEKVLVRIIGWEQGEKNPKGEVVDILGQAGDNDAEMHAILAEFGLPYSYPKEVEEAAEKLSGTISPEELRQREDFRQVTTFTIDPKDAKDFDDALSLRTLENGNYELGVHIADVSHFVEAKSIIDKEAYKRATSIYLVDRTIPMLPERLSNGLCSLRPDEEKYSYSCIFELNKEAKIIKYRIARTVIRSDRRFTYEEAQAIIKGTEDKYQSEILKLNELAQKLREERFKQGSISFERPEVRFNIDKKGKPLGVYIKESLEAHQLVEEFMLLANKSVAEFIAKGKKKAKTFVYRVHDRPEDEKINKFSAFISRMGYKLNTKGSDTQLSHSLNTLLKDVKGTARDNFISTIAIRTMAKAKYTTDNIGHYGLGFPFYTHFTSPIRRYPDLMVHRLLTRYIIDEKKSENSTRCEEQCKHSSEMELLASQAERASIKYKQVEFLSDYLGETFEGVISGLADWGIYVELIGNKCEGLIPIRELDDDYYNYIEEEYALVGEKRGKRFVIGDKLTIRVVQANLERKQLDFSLVEAEG